MAMAAGPKEAHVFKVDYKDVSSVQKRLARETVESIVARFSGKSGRILDIGCGDGKLTCDIADKVPHCEVVGLDVSESLIAYAASAYPRANLNFVVRDARNIDDVHAYDHIVSFFCLHWIPNDQKQRALDRIFRAVKPEGSVFFIIPLEDPLLLAIRRELVGAPPFDTLMKGYVIPFVESDKKVYFSLLETLKKGFAYSPLICEMVRHDLDLTSEDFKKFFSSFAPELRDHTLTVEERDLYLQRAVERMPKKANGNIDFNFRTITFSVERILEKSMKVL